MYMFEYSKRFPRQSRRATRSLLTRAAKRIAVGNAPTSPLEQQIPALEIVDNTNKFGIVQSSVVGTEAGYGMNDRRVGVRVPVGSRIFTSQYRPDRLLGPSTLLSNGYRGLFPEDKAAGA
jgi:hypothetical protein